MRTRWRCLSDHGLASGMLPNSGGGPVIRARLPFLMASGTCYRTRAISFMHVRESGKK